MLCRTDASFLHDPSVMINPDLVCALPGPLGRRYCAENLFLPTSSVPVISRAPVLAPNDSDASPASISTLMRRCRLGGEAEGAGPASPEFWFLRQQGCGEGEEDGRRQLEEEIFVRGGHCVRTQFSPVESSEADNSPGTPFGRLVSCTSDVVSVGEGETIVAACWAEFLVPQRGFAETGRKWTSVSVLNRPDGQRKEGICLLTSDNCLLFYTTEGEKYEARVPFRVWNMWPAGLGLLLERHPTEEELQTKSHLPCVFFLSHPLDEPSPVITHVPLPLIPRLPPCSSQASVTAEGRVQFACDPAQRCLFLCPDRALGPLLLSFSSSTSLHALWRLRAAKEAEFSPLLQPSEGPATASITPIPSLPSRLSRPPNSPLSPFARSLTRLTHSPRSPLLPQHLSKLSQSPGAPRLSSPKKLMPEGDLETEENEEGEAEPLLPQACLQLVWVEVAGDAKREQGAVKLPTRRMQQRVVGFVSEDYVRTRHLCFLMPQSQRLSCVKLEPIGAADGRVEDLSFAFGPVQTIPAQEAVYLSAQRLIVLVDPRQTVYLYSGTHKVCKLALPSLGTSPDLPMMSDSVPGSPKASESPPPKLSLQDPTLHAFTVDQIGSGISYRVYLPHLARSRLVRRCLSALRQVLPREVGLKLISHWYTLHHAPGSEPGRPGELVKLARFLLLSAGYGEAWSVVDRLTGRLEEGSTDQPAKRMRRGSGAAGDGHFAELKARLNRPGSSASRAVLSAVLDGWSMDGMEEEEKEEIGELNPAVSMLGRYLPVVMLALHLVYEDEKLIEEEWRQIDCLAGLLFILARDLDLPHYADIYRSEFPELVSDIDAHSKRARILDRHKLMWPGHFPADTTDEHPPHLMSWLVALLSNRFLIPFPLLPGVNDLTRTIVTAFVVFHSDADQLRQKETLYDRYFHLLPSTSLPSPTSLFSLPASCLLPNLSPLERLLAFLTHAGVDAAQLNRLPGGLSLAFREALRLCLLRPPPASPPTFRLVGREDLARQTAGVRPSVVRPLRDPPTHYTRHLGGGPGAGGAVSTARLLSSSQLTHPLLAALECDPVIQALFPSDLRVREAYRLLQSSTRVRLRPGPNRPDIPEDYQNQLLAVSVRTVALPVGRGLLTLHLHTGELPNRQIIAPICLQGKVGPRNINVELKKAETPATFKYWPEFHNGVASALVYSPHAPIDGSWILYTSRSLLKLGGESVKNSAAVGVSPERAGFLLGLGLNGHLNKLANYDIKRFKYHEMVTMALLLGLCAGRRASMDQKLTRILAIHYGPLLPPSHSQGQASSGGDGGAPAAGTSGGGGFSASQTGGAGVSSGAGSGVASMGSGDLEMHRYVQASAVMGLGLLYQGSAHRHMAEVLLREIGKGPGSDIAHREVMALTAGLALGLVMLGKGDSAHGAFHDLNVAHQLYAYMTGGLVRDATTAAGEGNNQIREGQHYNVDVTSPGATLALGLMFINTANRGIADWLAVPETQFLLDNVRPDLLLLRTLARGLIMWSSIEASDEWIDSHIPPVVRKFAFSKNRTGTEAMDGVDEEERWLWSLDNETMTLAYLNTECGCALAMALRFAGTADPAAYNILISRLRSLLKRGGGNPSSELMEANNRSAYEQALGLLLLSVSIVMAGTGNLELLCLCRMLRARVGQGTMFGVSYGCHMMYAMASGLLFLGGGKMTLDNSPESAAVLICALFPKFPCMGNDNKYHLQAFRHMAVLAARARCICPVSVSTNRVFPSSMRLVLRNGVINEHVKLPRSLPSLEQIERIEFHSLNRADAWPLHLSMDNPHHKAMLNNALTVMGGILLVQERDASSADEAAKLVLESYLRRMCDPLHMWQLKFLSVFTRTCPQLDMPSLISSDHWQSTVISINHRFADMSKRDGVSVPGDLAHGLLEYYSGSSSALTDKRVASFLVWHGLPGQRLVTLRPGEDATWRNLTFGQFCKRFCEISDTSVASLWQLFCLIRCSINNA